MTTRPSPTTPPERCTLDVQARPCTTCIYRPDLGWNPEQLEAQIADPHMAGYFTGHRVCHHSDDVVCHGFWSRFKDRFTLGQLAQRLGLVRFVNVDTLKER